MLTNSKFIMNTHIVVEDRDSWRNMGFNDKSKELPNKNGIPCFRKMVNVNKKITGATLTATALGLFDLFINDIRVGNSDGSFDELKPGWTDYNKRVNTFVYDVTELLHMGENMLLSQVSCGWYSCRISFGAYGFLPPAFCCELRIEYADGSVDSIVTDETWETALAGPVMNADIWDGEYYDAGVSPHNAEWEPATVDTKHIPSDESKIEGDKIYINCQRAGLPRIVLRKDLERVPLTATVFDGTKDNGTEYGEINIVKQLMGDTAKQAVELRAGQHLILDFGQNIVGRPHIKVKTAPGTKITFYFAELLNDSGDSTRGNDGAKGSTYVKNYRSALSRFVYVANGEGEEEYSPRHTFYGFRYLELCATDDIEIKVVGEVLTSNNRETCGFSCSNADVNKLWQNIVWGQRGNYLSIPTDCPQRDERLGWTGDTQIFCDAGSYIADTYDFMANWLQIARDTQCEDGAYCDVIPKVFKNPKFIGNAGWTDGCIIVPYRIYKKFGKIQIIKDHYESMEHYMEYVSQYGLEGANTAYGDWLCYEQTDKRYIAVCYYAYCASIMEYCSRLLNKEDRAEHYSRLYENIKSSFVARYIDSNGLNEKTQTGYLLGLKFGLIPNELREQTKQELRKKIEDNDYTLSTGFIGTGILCETLSELGMHDLCYSLLLQTKDPSWLYSVKQGATTVWERWNSYTIKDGFGNVEMNSFNHYAYGAVAAWLISYMTGITAFDFESDIKVTIAPKPDMRELIPKGQERITYALASFDSVFGTIKSSWQRLDNGFTYSISVPCRARIELCGREPVIVQAGEYTYTVLDK